MKLNSIHYLLTLAFVSNTFAQSPQQDSSAQPQHVSPPRKAVRYMRYHYNPMHIFKRSKSSKNYDDGIEGDVEEDQDKKDKNKRPTKSNKINAPASPAKAKVTSNAISTGSVEHSLIFLPLAVVAYTYLDVLNLD